MKRSQILITGASGCVGQYITYWLLNNSEADLVLLLRDKSKLNSVNPNNPRIKLLIGDIRNSELFADDLSTVTQVIHTVTAWGDPDRAYQVNIKAVKKLLKLLNPEIVEQIIYFSTASILNHELQPLSEALTYGTEYIQTKAQCLQELENHPLAEKIIAVFPTLVFGGRVDGKSPFPTSYLTSGITKAIEWLWLVRWIRGYSKFHFIHAEDIAFICGYLSTKPHSLNNQTKQSGIKRLVLGQPHITIDQAVDTLLKWRGMGNTLRIPLHNWLIRILIKILPIQLTNWDHFSIKHRHFNHDPVTTPETFGGLSHAKTLRDVLRNAGVPKR